MFLSSGFQAFLSKPIDIARLDAVIRQWLRDPDKEPTDADSETPEESYKDIESVFRGREVEGLNIQKGVERFRGDPDVYINILHSYAASTRSLLDAIETVHEDKIANYEITVHSIKGSSFGICADNVGKFAADLENAAKTGDLNFIKNHNQPFLDIANKLLSDLDELLIFLDSDNPKPKKDTPDEEYLKQLAAACTAYNMDAVDAAMTEISQYRYTADGGLADWLKENVETLNFEEIIKRLSDSGAS
jgi:HPt (histidine-containing phosphotransfer) domain-containing protein